MLNKYIGCLLGGAVGDALGYEVEFMWEKEIFEDYGENGITEYSPENNPALISDDTQMTLFTANGLLLGAKDGSYIKSVYNCYKEWYITQTSLQLNMPFRSWIMKVPELWARRAPGHTCMNAISSGKKGSVRNPINNSKGCGGVMRVAPVGLFFKNTEMLTQTDMISAEVSAITHGHELGYIPSACLAHIVSLVSHTDMKLIDAVKNSIDAMKKIYQNAEHIDYFCKLMNKAVKLAGKNMNDIDAIHELGEGWIAEETLAIAVYCVLKYEDNFEKAIIASVNHNGDSDSTGAVAGNIIGAYLGVEAIPEKFLKTLEIKDIITEIATDLYNYDTDDSIKRKYS